MDSKGYIAIFDEALQQEDVGEIVSIWLEKFNVEQVCPGDQAGSVTLKIGDVGQVIEEPNPQFRVMKGGVFAWVYFALGKCFVETSSLPDEENVMAVEALVDLPGIREVVDQRNERRLQELEAEGVLEE